MITKSFCFPVLSTVKCVCVCLLSKYSQHLIHTGMICTPAVLVNFGCWHNRMWQLFSFSYSLLLLFAFLSLFCLVLFVFEKKSTKFLLFSGSDRWFRNGKLIITFFFFFFFFLNQCQNCILQHTQLTSAIFFYIFYCEFVHNF